MVPMNPDVDKTIYDLYDENDEFVRTGTYHDAKKQNLFTRSVHILLSDSEGRVLVCKRPPTKRTYPGMITSSAGGHVDQGETYEQAAYRELMEELGVEVSLFDTGRFDVLNEHERTIHHLYVGRLDQIIQRTLQFDASEVTHWYYEESGVLQRSLVEHPDSYAQPFKAAFSLFTKPKTYVVDFDHTLFDWYGFKSDLSQQLEKYGISETLFTSTKHQQEARDGLYNVSAHLKELSLAGQASYTALENTLANLLQHAPEKYIYPDARIFLERLKNENTTSVLLTYGNADNQILFVRGTGVDVYFSKFIQVETREEKVTVVAKLVDANSGPLVIINDDPREATAMAPILPATTRNFLVERPNAKFASIRQHNDYVIVQSLEEVF